MSSFTDIFGGTNIAPARVSYMALTLTADVELSWPVEAAGAAEALTNIIDISAASPFAITMPDATKASVGEIVLFNNVGAATVQIKDNAGATLASIASGTVWQLYLVDNDIVAGAWRVFQYGVGVSVAQASALAGFGMKATGATLSQTMPVSTFNSNTTLGAPARAAAYVWTGAVGTLALEAAGTLGSDWFVAVRNGGTGNLTIDPSGAELINGGATLVLQPGDSAIILTDGAAWYTIGFGQDAVFAFDYTSINVTGLASPYTLSGNELNRIAYKFVGTLAADLVIIVPSTVQQYWVDNQTTGGSFTLGLKTAAQPSALTVPRGSRGIYYSDGSAVVKADTASIAVPISISDGGTGAITASAARTNLGASSIGNAVFTAASEAVARTAILAAASGANSDITSLSGLINLTLSGDLNVQGGTTLGNAGGDALTINSSVVTNPNGLTFNNGNIGIVTDGSANGISLRGRSSDNVSDLAFKSNDGVTTYGQMQGRTTDLRVQTVGALPLTILTNGGERMRVTASGVVLIGRTTETLGGGTGANLQIGSGSTNAGLTIHTGSGNVADIQFADGTGNPQAYAGMVRYDHGADVMSFWVNSASRFLITSAGIQLPGTIEATSRISSATGFNTATNTAYQVNNRNVIAADANTVMYLYSGGASGINFRNAADTVQIANISDAGAATFNGSVSAEGIELGYRDAPQVTKSGAFTFAASDRGKHIYYTGGAAAATIDPNASTALPIGTVIVVVNDGSGTLTITRGSGVVLLSNNVSVDYAVTPGNMATILKVGTDRWFVS